MTSFINNNYSKLLNEEKTFSRIFNIISEICFIIEKEKKNLILKTKLTNPNIFKSIYNIFGFKFLDMCNNRLNKESEIIKKNYSFENLKNKVFKITLAESSIIFRRLRVYCNSNNICYPKYIFNILNQEKPLLHIGFKENEIVYNIKININENFSIFICEQQIYLIKLFIKTSIITNSKYSIYDFIFLLELKDILEKINKILLSLRSKNLSLKYDILKSTKKIQKFFRKYKKLK